MALAQVRGQQTVAGELEQAAGVRGRKFLKLALLPKTMFVRLTSSVTQSDVLSLNKILCILLLC